MKLQSPLPDWFGASKVVDAVGAPLKVFHGTGAAFETFSKDRQVMMPRFWGRPGFFFTNSPREAAENADWAVVYRQGGANIIPAYLRIERPYVRKAYGYPQKWFDSNWRALMEHAQRNGNDGLIINGSRDGEGRTTYVVFEPDQIKSAIDVDFSVKARATQVLDTPARLAAARACSVASTSEFQEAMATNPRALKRFASLGLDCPQESLDKEAAALLEQHLRSRRFSAAVELVDALHARVGSQPLRLARALWNAMREGVEVPVNKRLVVIHDVHLTSFASACCRYRRHDILEAVIAAGPPSWLKADVQPAQWLANLNSYVDDGLSANSLIDIASRWMEDGKYPAEATLATIRLAIKYDMNEPYFSSVSGTWPELGALIRQERMRMQIHASGPVEIAVPVAPRRASRIL